MQIIRYLNGVPLSGAMPPLVLPFSLPRQHVPLPPRARSAILKAEERSPLYTCAFRPKRRPTRAIRSPHRPKSSKPTAA